MTPIDLALATIAIAFALCLVRGLRGPTVADRAVAGDLALYAVVIAIALLAVRTGETAFIDVVLIATFLGFLTSLALSALVGRDRS